MKIVPRKILQWNKQYKSLLIKYVMYMYKAHKHLGRESDMYTPDNTNDIITLALSTGFLLRIQYRFTYFTRINHITVTTWRDEAGTIITPDLQLHKLRAIKKCVHGQ